MTQQLSSDAGQTTVPTTMQQRFGRPTTPTTTTRIRKRNKIQGVQAIIYPALPFPACPTLGFLCGIPLWKLHPVLSQADVKCNFYCSGKTPDFPFCQQTTLEKRALQFLRKLGMATGVNTAHNPFRPLPDKYIYIKCSISHPGLRETAFLRSVLAKPSQHTSRHFFWVNVFS